MVTDSKFSERFSLITSMVSSSFIHHPTDSSAILAVFLRSRWEILPVSMNWLRYWKILVSMTLPIKSIMSDLKVSTYIITAHSAGLAVILVIMYVSTFQTDAVVSGIKQLHTHFACTYICIYVDSAADS